MFDWVAKNVCFNYRVPVPVFNSNIHSARSYHNWILLRQNMDLAWNIALKRIVNLRIAFYYLAADILFAVILSFFAIFLDIKEVR